MIAPQFDLAVDFSEGLAAVCFKEKKKNGEKIKWSRGRWGYIDKTGELVIKPQFISAHDFSEGLARVHVEGYEGDRLGYINKKGEWVWEPTK